MSRTDLVEDFINSLFELRKNGRIVLFHFREGIPKHDVTAHNICTISYNPCVIHYPHTMFQLLTDAEEKCHAIETSTVLVTATAYSDISGGLPALMADSLIQLFFYSANFSFRLNTLRGPFGFHARCFSTKAFLDCAVDRAADARQFLLVIERLHADDPHSSIISQSQYKIAKNLAMERCKLLTWCRIVRENFQSRLNPELALRLNRYSEEDQLKLFDLLRSAHGISWFASDSHNFNGWPDLVPELLAFGSSIGPKDFAIAEYMLNIWRDIAI